MIVGLDESTMSRLVGHIFGHHGPGADHSSSSFNHKPTLPLSKRFRKSNLPSDNLQTMGKNTTEPETAESIIARHMQVQESRNRFVNQARDAKRKLAAARGIPILRWEEYWAELDEWRVLMVEQEVERELYRIGQAPTPPTTPIPRPGKPGNLENVGGNSVE